MREMLLPIKCCLPAAGNSYLQLAMDRPSLILRAYDFGSVQHSLPDSLVGSAAAKISAQSFFNLFKQRVRLLLEKCNAGHYESGSAKPALLSVILYKSAHQRVEFASLGEVFDRGYFVPLCFDGKNGASIHRFIIQQHRTGAACRPVAHFLSPCDIQPVPQCI